MKESPIKNIAPWLNIAKLFQNLSGSAAAIMNSGSANNRYYGSGSRKGMIKNAAHVRATKKRQRRRAHFRGLRRA